MPASETIPGRVLQSDVVRVLQSWSSRFLGGEEREVVV